MDDKEYILSLKAGKTEALTCLIDKYGNYVAKILQSFLGAGLSQQDLEEITSDVFFALWQQRLRLHENEAIKGYIAAIAKNTGRKRLKKLKHTEPLPEECQLASDELTPEESLEKSEEAQTVLALIKTLNGIDREIFFRHYYFEQTASEISKTMQIKRSTILSKLARGRVDLKIKIGGTTR